MKKKKLKPLFIVLLVFAVIFVSVNIYRSSVLGKIDTFITEKNIVYTPEGIANKFHHDFAFLDIYNYWVFKLNKTEQEAILSDIENNSNWSLMNGFDESELEMFDYFGSAIKNSSKNNECYICVYDNTSESVITAGAITGKSSNWIVFVYDTESNYYSCIWQSV